MINPACKDSLLYSPRKSDSVVGHEGVVAFENERHHLPVFKASETQMVNVIGDMACPAREVNQGQMQAFINQQLCH
jgi:hypothetical protein